MVRLSLDKAVATIGDLTLNQVLATCVSQGGDCNRCILRIACVCTGELENGFPVLNLTEFGQKVETRQEVCHETVRREL